MQGIQHLAGALEEIFTTFLSKARGVVSGVRYYHYDPLLRELHSAFSYGKHSRLNFVPSELVRTFSAKNIYSQVPFCCIDLDTPVLVSVRIGTTDTRLVDLVKGGGILEINLHQDPCPELNKSNGPRRWLDIPCVCSSRATGIVGKLTFSIEQDAPFRDIAKCVNSLTKLSGEFASVLECAYLRDFYLPLRQMEMRLLNASSIEQAAQYIVEELESRYADVKTSVYLVNEDHLKGYSTYVLHSNDPLAWSDSYFPAPDRPTAITSEADACLYAIHKKETVLMTSLDRGVMAISEREILTTSNSCQLSSGARGSLLIVPIPNDRGSESPIGVVAIRKAGPGDRRYQFTERESHLVERICKDTLAKRMTFLREQESHVVFQDSKQDGLTLGRRIIDAGTNHSSRGELSVALGRIFESAFIGENCRNSDHMFLFNVIDDDGGIVRSLYRSGDGARGFGRSEPFSLDGSFTKIVTTSKEGVVSLGDVPSAMRRGMCRGAYPNVLSAIGAEVRANERVFGAFVVLSAKRDLTMWRYAKRIQVVADQAAAILANRMSLDCAISGLGHEVRRVLSLLEIRTTRESNVRELTRLACTCLDMSAKLSLGLSHRGHQRPRKLELHEQIRLLSNLVPSVDIELEESFPVNVRIDVECLQMVLYKLLLAAESQSKTKIRIEADVCPDSLILTLKCSGLPGFGVRFAETLDLRLSDDLPATGRSFKSGQLASLRFARSLASTYPVARGISGSLRAIEINDQDCILSLMLPLPES